jgi:hypothetical protein
MHLPLTRTSTFPIKPSAGVTLLALGNGAADIFSALAAVTASPDGGQLAVAGLCVRVHVFRQMFTLVDVIEFHDFAPLEALACA